MLPNGLLLGSLYAELGHIEDKQSYMEEVISRAEKLISERLAEDIDMEALAAELNVGYTWFRRSFKKFTGKSPGQYHLALRLEKATYLLAKTQKSIGEISQLLGYDSQDYFSALFKRKTGLSPMKFRNENSQ